MLNPSVTPPFQLDDENLSETTRLLHRVLDLRRPYMQNNLMLRYRVTMEVRKFLDANGFNYSTTAQFYFGWFFDPSQACTWQKYGGAWQTWHWPLPRNTSRPPGAQPCWRATAGTSPGRRAPAPCCRGSPDAPVPVHSAVKGIA